MTFCLKCLIDTSLRDVFRFQRWNLPNRYWWVLQHALLKWSQMYWPTQWIWLWMCWRWRKILSCFVWSKIHLKFLLFLHWKPSSIYHNEKCPPKVLLVAFVKRTLMTANHHHATMVCVRMALPPFPVSVFLGTQAPSVISRFRNATATLVRTEVAALTGLTPTSASVYQEPQVSAWCPLKPFLKGCLVRNLYSWKKMYYLTSMSEIIRTIVHTFTHYF